MHTRDIGDRAEGMVLAALLQAGHRVLIPFSDNERYDFVIDVGGGKFHCIQCKNGRLRKGRVKFAACSFGRNKAKNARNYRGEADYFGVYCPETNKSYLIPVDDVPTTYVALRVDSPKNGQVKGIRMAADFEIMPT